MLQLNVKPMEFYDESTNKFVRIEGTTLQLEHSLVSVSKWESKWHKVFLGKDAKQQKTQEEMIDYVRCMTITQNVDPRVYLALSQEDYDKISKYIEDPMTATWFSEDRKKGRPNREIVTSELIYYWMIALNIPFECQKWHLNRLMTLIRVCNAKNSPPKKMSKAEAMNKQRALNASRRKSTGSLG